MKCSINGNIKYIYCSFQKKRNMFSKYQVIMFIVLYGRFSIRLFNIFYEHKLFVLISEIDWLNGMKKCELLQFWFRQELAVALDLPLPDDINQRIDDPEFDNDQNFGDLDLTELADQRRSHVVSALINMIRRGPLRNVDDDVYLLWMSRMVGLYMSARVPTSYIKQVWTNTHKRTFTLWDGITHKRYKRILGVWNQINLNNSGSVQLLENQLRRLDEELILL
ncbi:uncharacterized protein LOC126837597 isoform X1 [Adelges cooleyi]|uniref:uncharacterized protein LOC126837597 isoform X1 n=1 Tax=Adelges cooleyi TaxID=133065 RepID=UPI0021808D68|nr:uncharacterized protein LOC126837597 isoform X1 [Adelges cooleyi]XP_050427482.1 uncharacterized protein LOC126837597 isoform X1 [Adelges cooleyi]